MGVWVAGLSGNIDHLNPIEVEVEVGLGFCLAKLGLANFGRLFAWGYLG